MAHPIIQAGEDPEANGAGHYRWGCTTSTFIKRLEETEPSKLRGPQPFQLDAGKDWTWPVLNTRKQNLTSTAGGGSHVLLLIFVSQEVKTKMII